MRNGSHNEPIIPFLFLLLTTTTAALLLLFVDYTNRICHSKSILFLALFKCKKLRRNFQFFLFSFLCTSFVLRFVPFFFAISSLTLSEIKIGNNYFVCKYGTYIHVLLLIAHLILLLGRAASLKTLLALVMILPMPLLILLLLLLSSSWSQILLYLHKKWNSWAHSGYDFVIKLEKKRKTFLLF